MPTNQETRNITTKKKKKNRHFHLPLLFWIELSILERIYTGYQFRERANLSVWWPGILKEIEAKVESCQFCQQHQPTQRKEPLTTTVLHDRPWQKDLYRFVSARRSEIPSGNGLLLKIY